ncbi:MAG TPA: MFS transporter [Microbacteriaceae bacterium]|nr:MFS transporter [Microbacteriaceae bacterium]HRA08476.1 MFS transporter [Microbacteriaceae bacterium]
MTSSAPVAMGFTAIPGAEHFGVTTAQYLIYFTLFLVTAALTFSVMGRLITRFGVRAVLISTGTLASLAGVGMAFSPNIYVFYLFAFVLGLGAAGNNLLPAKTLVVGWHVHKRRGTVLGFVATGGATGGLLIGLIFPSVMAAGGFVGGWLAIAAMAFVCSVVTGIFLAKNPPIDHEEGAGDEAAGEEEAVHPATKNGRKALIKGFGFTIVLLAIGSFLFSLEGAFGSVQAAVYPTFGIDLSTAGLMIAFYSVCGIVAKPLLGIMHDKLGMKPLFVALTVLFILGMPALALTMQMGWNLMFPILAISAISLSIPGVIIPLVAVNAAGRERFATIYGFMLTGSYIGTGIGVPLWGLVYDITGAFTLAMYVGGAAGLIGLALAYIGLQRGIKTRAAMNESSTTGIFLPDGTEASTAERNAAGTGAGARDTTGAAEEVASS